MSTVSREDLAQLFRTTTNLSASQRLVAMLYATVEPQPNGAIRKTGAQLAELAGLNPQLFARARMDLIRGGFLQEVEDERVGVVRYYRLTLKALGREDDRLPAAA